MRNMMRLAEMKCSKDAEKRQDEKQREQEMSRRDYKTNKT